MTIEIAALKLVEPYLEGFARSAFALPDASPLWRAVVDIDGIDGSWWGKRTTSKYHR